MIQADRVPGFDLSRYATKKPPANLEPQSFKAGLGAATLELGRLGGLEPMAPTVSACGPPQAKHPPVSVSDYARLVLAEAWCAYVAEAVEDRDPDAPLDSVAAKYINNAMTKAARNVHHYVTHPVTVWQPKMWHRNSGRLHRAVERVIRLRIRANGGGCELCRAPTHRGESLDQHHLHYRSFGYEVPSDVIRLCRNCHDERHRAAGYPRDATWTDCGISWGRRVA